MSSRFQEKMNRQGRAYITSLRNTVAACWIDACRHDGIDVESKFIVFSEDNPVAPYYNLAVQQYQEALSQYRAGGYVGVGLSNLNR